ncbi:DNA starvation/stationary phase protection protein [uncultured Tateyamaria sp.]|uniref:Dps family protein n=1 Tax=uncultured Tateyamaria sp. TaxID=455651 RepID=UPI00261F3491|nr:DNA starvation/stationary phase protection protein [uncultured Tateyamaria sp.]
MISATDSNIEILKVVLGKTFRLYVQTHSYHWNVEGHQFFRLHKIFEEQYTNLWETLDELAERIRALGAFAPGSVADFMALAGGSEAASAQSADDMVNKLIDEHNELAEILRNAIQISENAEDDVSAGILTDRLTWHEKTIWMLKAGQS